MGCSSEAARKRKQRSINGGKQNYNSNYNLSQSDSNKNNNKNNNHSSCCDNHKSSNSNNLLSLSSEFNCQSNSDNEDESTITKANNNCLLQQANKTTVKAVEKTQNPHRAQANCEAKETERRRQSERSNISGSAETEAVAVLVEEGCKFCATCQLCCTCTIDINNNNNKSNTNRQKDKGEQFNNNNNKEVNTCENDCRTTGGSNNCCDRHFAREQLPQARVVRPPQTEKDVEEQETQTQHSRDELWHTRCVGVWPATTEICTNKSASHNALEACDNCEGIDAAATHNKHHSQRMQKLLRQARNTLTKRLVGLSDDMRQAAELASVEAAEEQSSDALGTRAMRRSEHECSARYEQPLQLAYKGGRRECERERGGKQQQQHKQRNDRIRFGRCVRRRALQHEDQQPSAFKYCHHKQQQNDHQKPQQQLQKLQQQPQQQMPVNNKKLKQMKSTQPQQQLQQHHSAQALMQQEQQNKQEKLLQHMQLQQKPQHHKKLQQKQQLQQQQQQQQQQRHRLRRGIQTMAAAAYGAFSYIGHNYYHLLGNTISFYAASSVILVLCYLTTTTSAAYSADKAPFDRHPIRGIDWTKFDESSSDKEILDLLLEKKRYDKRLLPPVNDEDFCCGLSSPDMAKVSNSRRPHNRGTLTVNVNVLLLSLASPDESSLKYEVEFLLNQQWNDPRLQYGNKSHYDFLNALHHHDSIWTPDTYFIMHGDFKDPIIPMHFALRIYRNGTITYAMRRHLILSCQGSLHIFPFDDPKCSFSMESISYEEAQIKYVWKNDEDTLRKSPSLTTLNAYLIKNQTTPCDQNSWRGNYSCLRVDLIFTRDRAFYFTTVFIPGIILVTSSFITFWLEWNAVPARSMIGNYSCLEVELTFTRDRAYYFTTVFIPGIILVTSSFITFWLEWNAVPARVMIGVTTMLNFFTTSNGFRSTLPVVSNLTAMNVWDGVCMCFIYASLLEFVCVNYMGRKRPQHNAVYRPGENPVTQRLPAVLSRIGVILASPLAATQGASSGSTTAGTSIPVTPTPHMMHTYQAHMSTPTQQQQQQWAQSPPPPPQPATAYGTTTTGGVSTVDAPRIRWEEQHGGIIGVAMQTLRARSIRRRTRSPGSVTSTGSTYADTETGRTRSISTTMSPVAEPVYQEPTFEMATSNGQRDTTVTVEMEPTIEESHRTISTNTPPLITSGSRQTETEEEEAASNGTQIQTEAVREIASGAERAEEPTQSQTQALESQTIADASGHLPVKPPRRKRSRSNSPAPLYEEVQGGAVNGHGGYAAETGEKRRDVRAPNEIVACTTCGGSSSPCTHSANNGCATETCFVQVRKKEPPHPIRIAKTIDVIARITFPTAYSIFLIFFFVHYKGFS